MARGNFDWCVRGPLGEVVIELYPASAPDPAAREASMRELAQLIYDFTYREPHARRVVREVYARLCGLHGSALRGDAFDIDPGSPRAAAMSRELTSAARAGSLVVRRRPLRRVTIPLEHVEEALGPEAEPIDWIEIELVDKDGKPVPNVEYRLECDDGRVRTGTTGLSGLVREEGLHGGNCKVSFPGLNPPDWSKVA
jgi:hypothetical protein